MRKSEPESGLNTNLIVPAALLLVLLLYLFRLILLCICFG